jgi:hypothetical protein
LNAFVEEFSIRLVIMLMTLGRMVLILASSNCAEDVEFLVFFVDVHAISTLRRLPTLLFEVHRRRSVIEEKGRLVRGIGRC